MPVPLHGVPTVPGVCRQAVSRSQLCSLAATVASEIPPSDAPKDELPMPAEPSHPVHALTTYEISRYRRELERAIKGISPDAPVQADLKRKLDEVLAEQAERARIAAHAHP